MKITSLDIKKFRNLSDIEIFFSNRINAIAGQNGTSKTSLLGLIGHVFSFYTEEKNLFGKTFSTEFSEIFKFAYPKYDKAGDHIWTVKFDSRDSIKAASFARKESLKKNDIRIRVGKSMQGSGKIKFPVIYLGMGRLFPLAIESTIKCNETSLTEKEIKEFNNLHNEILLMVDENIVPESIESSTKKFYAPSTKRYNHLGNSAGQDNIGQIITALMSFKRLRDRLGNSYKGGILLIDELDASLFPGAQIELVNKLYKKSLELDLQIFFTTHSLEVLSEVSKLKDSKIIYLDKNSGKIKPEYNIDIDNLKQDLLVLGPDVFKKIKKDKYIYCEDNEAVDMLKNILKASTKKQVNIFSAGLGEGVLKDIAKSKMPDLKKAVIILDGDSSDGKISNVLCLPGKFGPDRIIYDFLKNIDDSHFSLIKDRYNKQVCFKRLLNLDNLDNKTELRKKIKNWYKEQRKYWGVNGRKVWQMWAGKNKELISEFNEKIEKLI